MTQHSKVEPLQGADRRYLLGCLIIVAGGLVLSLGAFTVRLAPDAGPWQYTGWRAFAFIGAMWLIARLRESRAPSMQLRQLRPIAWIGALMLALASTTFIAAIKTTTLAETFFLCSLSPLIAAALARPILGERMSGSTLIAVALGILGVLVMVEGRLAGGNWSGRVLALLSALGFAGYSLAARGSLPRDLNATLIVFGILSAVVGIGATLALGEPLVPPVRDIVMALIHGAAVLSLGLALFAQGSRFVSAVTLAVLAQTEAVFGPLWGFLFFSEVPTLGTVGGGGIILAAVVLQAVRGAPPRAAGA